MCSNVAHNIFITANDTNAGKTFVTSRLVRALLGMGIDALAIKPVASGLDREGRNEDVETLLAAQGISDPDTINLYRFHMPAAPAMAARAEKAEIDKDRLVDWCCAKGTSHDVCLLEGVGGLMVPLGNQFHGADWLAAMPDCETLLIVSTKLGAMNHALLTLDKLKQMGRMPQWIVLNDSENHGAAMTAGVFQSLVDFGIDKEKIFSLPNGADHAAFMELAEALLANPA